MSVDICVWRTLLGPILVLSINNRMPFASSPGASVGNMFIKWNQPTQHVFEALEEMTGVPMTEIRVILHETHYEMTGVIHRDKILPTESSVATLTIKDWF